MFSHHHHHWHKRDQYDSDVRLGKIIVVVIDGWWWWRRRRRWSTRCVVSQMIIKEESYNIGSIARSHCIHAHIHRDIQSKVESCQSRAPPNVRNDKLALVIIGHRRESEPIVVVCVCVGVHQSVKVCNVCLCISPWVDWQSICVRSLRSFISYVRSFRVQGDRWETTHSSILYEWMKHWRFMISFWVVPCWLVGCMVDADDCQHQ